MPINMQSLDTLVENIFICHLKLQETDHMQFYQS